MSVGHEVKEWRTLLGLAQADMATELGFSGPTGSRREIIRRVEAGEREHLPTLLPRLEDLRQRAPALIAHDANKTLRSALALQHAIAYARVVPRIHAELVQAFHRETRRLRVIYGLPKALADQEIPNYVSARLTSLTVTLPTAGKTAKSHNRYYRGER